MNIFDLFNGAGPRPETIVPEVEPNASVTLVWSTYEDMVSKVSTWTQFYNPDKDIPSAHWCPLAEFMCPPLDHPIYDFLNHLKITNQDDKAIKVGRQFVASFEVILQKGFPPCIFLARSTIPQQAVHHLMMHQINTILPEELFNKVSDR